MIFPAMIKFLIITLGFCFITSLAAIITLCVGEAWTYW